MSQIPEKVMLATRKFFGQSHSYLNAVIFLLEIESLSRSDSAVLKIYGEFETSLKPLSIDARSYFRCSLYFLLISAIEIYFQELLKAVLTEHPKKMGSTQFKLAEILDANSSERLIEMAAEDFLNQIMYKKPLDYLKELEKIFSVDLSSIYGTWAHFIEAKARRDLGIHNSWICNDIYLRKLSEANFQTEAKKGDVLLPTDKDYFRSVVDNLSDISKTISFALVEKYPESS